MEWVSLVRWDITLKNFSGYFKNENLKIVGKFEKILYVFRKISEFILYAMKKLFDFFMNVFFCTLP